MNDIVKKRQIVILSGVGSVLAGGFFALIFWIIVLGIDPFWVGFFMILSKKES